MFVKIGKIFLGLIILWGCAVWGYEQQILKENDLDKIALFLNKKDVKKQDIYLIISKLDYLGARDPRAYVLLGDLYQQNKLFASGMTALSDAERTERAIKYYNKASSRSIEANQRLAVIYAHDKKQHLFYVLNAALLGDLDAKQKIAIAFDGGWRFPDASLNSKAEILLGLAPREENDHSNVDVRIKNVALPSSTSVEINLPEKNFSPKKELTKNSKSVYLPDSPQTQIPATDQTTIKSHINLNIDLLQRIIIRFALLGCVGLIFASCKKVYLFYNLADVVISSLVSFVILGLFMSVFNGDGNNENFAAYSIIVVALIVALIPFSIAANPGAWWSFLIVVPAKAIIGCLGIIAVLGSLGKLMETINNKKERGTNFVTALIFGALAYGIYKLIMKTTKNR